MSVLRRESGFRPRDARVRAFPGYTFRPPRSLCPGLERVSKATLRAWAAAPRALERDFEDDFLGVPHTLVREL